MGYMENHNLNRENTIFSLVYALQYSRYLYSFYETILSLMMLIILTSITLCIFDFVNAFKVVLLIAILIFIGNVFNILDNTYTAKFKYYTFLNLYYNVNNLDTIEIDKRHSEINRHAVKNIELFRYPAELETFRVLCLTPIKKVRKLKISEKLLLFFIGVDSPPIE